MFAWPFSPSLPPLPSSPSASVCAWMFGKAHLQGQRPAFRGQVSAIKLRSSVLVVSAFTHWHVLLTLEHGSPLHPKLDFFSMFFSYPAYAAGTIPSLSSVIISLAVYKRQWGNENGRIWTVYPSTVSLNGFCVCQFGPVLSLRTEQWCFWDVPSYLSAWVKTPAYPQLSISTASAAHSEACCSPTYSFSVVLLPSSRT